MTALSTALPIGVVRRWGRTLLSALFLGLLAFAIFGPFVNLGLWSVAEKWYFPAKLPIEYGFSFWERVFRPQGRAMESLWLSLIIAFSTVIASLALSIPAGYALGRRRVPVRWLIMLAFLLPQALPSIAIFANVGRIFYSIGLNGTILGVVLVHTAHGLVLSVWICSASFASVNRETEEAARNIGASPFRAFFDVTLPQAMPGIMASAIFVFLASLDEFTGVYFVGIPDIHTLPILLFTASMEGNYQIASITALILLVPSVLFMLIIERFLRADVLAKVGA